MMSQNVTVIITFGIYLAGMLAIGIYAYRRTQDASDYFLGGRSLGPWPAALSAGASDMSGWLLLGLPGYAYLAGLESAWLAGGLLLGTWANWRFVARRLRVASILADDALTMPDFFARRFDDRSGTLQVIAAVLILLFFLFYTSSGLVAGGKLFEAVFGLDYSVAVIAGTLCVVSYTLFGGFLAVSWTDLVQGLLMVAALILVPVIALVELGGPGDVIAHVLSANDQLLNPLTGKDGQELSLIAIVSLLVWGLGYFGQPHILARFAAVRSNDDIPKARRIAVTWSSVSMLGALLVGLVGFVYVQAHPGMTLDDSEKIFMMLVSALFHPAVAGVLLAAILAAIMSTADSQLLVCSAAFTQDMYRRWFRPNATAQESVLVGRIAVIVMSLIALWLAMTPDSSVLGLVSYAWAGFGAAFGPVVIFSLYWRRMNRWGALAGMIAGGMAVVVWKPMSGGWFDVYELLPGFILASLAIVVASLFTPAPGARVTDLYDAV